MNQVVMRRRATSGDDDVVFFFGGCSGVGRVLTTGVVMRRRATSGEMARGRLVFVFSWGLLRCRACVDHRSGHAAPCHLRRDGTRKVGFCFFFGGCSGVSCGAVPPQERWHEEGWFLFFSLEVAPMGFFHRLGSGWHPALRRGRRGEVSFCFSLAVAPVSEGNSFTRTGVDGARG